MSISQHKAYNAVKISARTKSSRAYKVFTKFSALTLICRVELNSGHFFKEQVYLATSEERDQKFF